MYTKSKRDELLLEFEQKADEGFATLKGYLGIGQAMKDGNASAVREGINSLKNLLISVIPFGIAVPKAYLYTSSMSSDGNAISMVTITISSRANDPQEFHFTTTVLGSDVEQKVYSFLKSVYVTLVENEMAKVNVAHVNDVLSQATAEAGLGYAIRVVTPLGNNGKKIAYLADDEVVFVADTHRLFDIDSMIIFMTEPTELISEDRIQETYSKLVDALAKAQTTVQLVSMHGGDLISLLCDISKRIKPMTIVSKVYPKNILSLKSDKDGVGYYNKDGVYAVVARKGGSLELVLKPINTQTMEPSDYDVLSAVQNAS